MCHLRNVERLERGQDGWRKRLTCPGEVSDEASEVDVALDEGSDAVLDVVHEAGDAVHLAVGGLHPVLDGVADFAEHALPLLRQQLHAG